MSLPTGPNLAPVEVREATPERRPADHPAPVRAAVVLMVLGAVLAAVDAVVKLLAWDRDDLEQRLDDAGISPGNLDGFLTIVRVVGFVGGLVVAGIWIGHAVACDRGRSWARPWATALAGIFLLMNLVDLGTAESALGVAYLALRTALAAAVVVLLWLPPSTAFFRAAAKLVR
ncbi:MAG TPA: hypothetical protein VGO60_03735 [Iamia sp.]|nr:hypothetical protein [Iamia sp.]